MNNQPGMTIERFTAEYNTLPGWEIGGPQPALREHFERSLPESPVLDIGCGSGDLAIFLASLGCETLGIDFVPKAIELARKKAEALTNKPDFEVCDVFALEDLHKTFRTIADCFFFHMLDDDARVEYANTLRNVLAPGGKLVMLNFAQPLPAPESPRGISESEIRACFKDGWKINVIRLAPGRLTYFRNPIEARFAVIEKL